MEFQKHAFMTFGMPCLGYKEFSHLHITFLGLLSFRLVVVCPSWMKNEEVLCFHLLLSNKLPQNLTFKQQTFNIRVSGSGIMEVTRLGACGSESFRRLWSRCWFGLRSPEGFPGAGGSAFKLILVGFTQSECFKREQEGSQCFQ